MDTGRDGGIDQSSLSQDTGSIVPVSVKSTASDFKVWNENADLLLNPVEPMLKCCLSKKEIVQLARELTITEYFSKAKYQEFKSALTADVNAAANFLNFFKAHVKENWNEELLKAFTERGLFDLKEVVEYHFNNPESTSWFLSNWNDFENNKDILVLTAQTLSFEITVNENDKFWLISFLRQLTVLGNDALQQLKTTLDEHRKSKVLPSQKGNKNEIDLSSVGETQGRYAMDVAESLQPLVPLLSYCLISHKLLLDIAKALYIDEHVSNESINKLKTVKDFDDCVLLFISCLKNEAEENWKISFVDALEAEELTSLHFIVKSYFNNANKLLCWIVLSWEVLVNKKENLMRVAHDQGLCVDMSAETELCVLHVVCSVLQMSDEMQDQFFVNLQAAVIENENEKAFQNSQQVAEEEENESNRTETDVEDMDVMEKPAAEEEGVEQMEVDDYGGAGDVAGIRSKVVVEQPLGNAATIAEVAESGDHSIERLDSLNIDWPVDEDCYKMEFRVVIADGFNLPEGGCLMLFIDDRGTFPMHFNPKLNFHQQILSMPTSNFNHIYKYFVSKQGFEDQWEKVPFCKPVWNRKCCIDADQIKIGHAVAFDAIFFEKNKDKFDTSFQGNMTRLVPSFGSIPDNASPTDAIKITIDMCDQWTKSYFSKKEFVNKSNVRKETGPQGTNDALARYFKLEADRMEANRVAEIFCLYWAIHRRKSMSIALKNNICLGLSLDLLDDDQYLLFMQQFDALRKYFETFVEFAPNNFESLLKTILLQLDDVPHFLLLLPLLKLTENSNPCDPPTVLTWEKIQKGLLKSEKQQKSLLDLKDKIRNLSKRFSWMLKPYFDTLTLESVGKLLEAVEDHFVGADILLNKLFSFWEHLSSNPHSKQGLTERLLTVICFFATEDLKSRLEETHAERTVDEENLYLVNCLSACVKTVDKVKQNVKSLEKNQLQFSRCVFNTCNELIKYAQEISKKLNVDVRSRILSMVEKLKKQLLSVAILLVKEKASYSKKYLDIEAWNCVMDVEWFDEDFKKIWLDDVHMNIVEVTRRVFKEPSKLIDYYCTQLEDAKPHKLINEWLTEIAIDEFVKFVIAQNPQKEKQLVGNQWNKFQKRFKKKSDARSYKTKVVSVCAKVLKKQWKNWPKYEGSTRLKFLEFVQNWTTLFLETIIEQKMAEELPNDVTKEIVSIKENLLKVMRDLQFGQITVECLQKVAEIKTEFFGCLNVLQLSKPQKDTPKLLSQNEFDQVIKLRMEELSHYEDTIVALASLTNFFISVTQGQIILRCEDLQRFTAQQVGHLRLGTLVACRASGSGRGGKRNVEKPHVINLPLPAEDLLIVMELHKNKVFSDFDNSRVIRKQLLNAVKKAKLNGHNQISFHEALELLWKPLQKEATTILTTLVEGTITLKQINDAFFAFDDRSEMDTVALRKELNYLYGIAVGVKVNQNKRKIHVQSLQNYMNLKKSMRCAELLQEVQTFLKLEGKFTELINIMHLLQEAEHFPLTAMKELTDHVQKILGLQIVEDFYFETLEKFLDAAKLIEWLKENVKESKKIKAMIDLCMVAAGEVPMEVDRVSCFNSAVMGFAPLVFDLQPNGGFNQLLSACKEVWENVTNDPSVLENWVEASKQLGWLDYVQSFHGSVEKSSLEKAELINSHGVYVIKCEKDVIPTLEESIQLHITKPDSRMKMSLSDVRDLQSRLMLIAGETAKGKEDVSKFIKVLSGVENLTKTYVKLKTFGCSLFADWSVMIRCSNEGSKDVTLEVFFDDNSEPITSSYNIVEELINLTTILDGAYAQWMTFLTQSRNKHYHLNHFTIQQLTYLCKELASTDDYKDQVYQLLASVLPDVSEDIIASCLEAAFQQDEDEEAEEIKEDEPLIWLEYESVLPDAELIQDMTENHSFTLKKVITHLQSKASSDNAAMTSIIKTICRIYFKATAITSLQDFLSLEHCGKFLTHLANRCNPDNLPRRNWAGQFTEGKPNLLICLQPKNLLLMLLSVYIHSQDQCLPSASEVLLCSENTTAEEVELLFRRAVGLQADTGDRIYCLAHADLLPFNVSKQVEECFESLMQIGDRNERFKLIILTCSEQHYLTSCFYEHKIEGFRLAKKKDLRAYIKQNLGRQIAPSAFAGVDRSRSSVVVVRSTQSGMGKSLYISRCRDQVCEYGVSNSTTIRLLEKSVDADDVSMALIRCGNNADAHFVHVDITPSVQTGKSKLLFDLLILGMIQNSRGVVWRHLPSHLYMLEYTKAKEQVDVAFSKFLNLLPSVTCLSPVEVRDILQENPNRAKPEDQVFMDAILLESEMYQRPYQYLSRYKNGENLDNFVYSQPNRNSLECLNTLLRYCSVESPSWSELSHFSKFLNTQLRDCEESDFCNPQVLGDEFRGFKQFVVRFMIKMSQDFATPSLHGSHEVAIRTARDPVQKTDLERINEKFWDSLRLFWHTVLFLLYWTAFLFRKAVGWPIDDDDDDDDDDDLPTVSLLHLHQLQRCWESSLHPYVFFNADRHSMSFANFKVNDRGSLCDPKNLTTEIEQNVMRTDLVQALKRNGVDLQQDIDKMSREKKLALLCQVFGVKAVFDPDKTYELTTDNVLKMLAIQMRFRCGIPVVMMGETGCGKTRMVEFMCKLKRGDDKNFQNMVVVKVHGGITASMVQEKVEEAITLARQNKMKIEQEQASTSSARQNNDQNTLETILFLDEANTTEAVYAIKEIMCDETVRGKSFVDSGLRIVAACNPYREHPPEIIETMEKSGLGFHVRPEDVSDTFDDIPMRHLVYRVIALPPSMRPLVWDFGQLSNDTEEVYINQMVLRLQREISSKRNVLELTRSDVKIITKVTTASQVYMRSRCDICNFVSLRDAERTMQSFKWFYEQLPMLKPLIEKQKQRMGISGRAVADCTRALIQALSVCYYVTLSKRKSYRSMLAKEMVECGNYSITEQMILDEIIACQNVFISAIELENNIACNEALRENVFMMVICAEMRIPLFLVGKPGSSKSLAKTIVTDAMQGKSSRNELYRQLKEIHVLSFQCSAVTDAVGIEAVFAQCAQLQKKKDCSKYVAMVVLDEIGLAEDSKKMPLKVLHPLLETASTSNVGNVEPYQKVGFVGISNWALDPAKMNRGIFVTRGKPSNEDLHKTAVAIFESDLEKLHNASRCIKAVTDAYLEIYEGQDREFFGLRDYYAMMKMLCVSTGNEALTFNNVGGAVIRNFSGGSSEVSKTFQKHCSDIFDDVELPNIPVKDLIRSNLNPDVECRFLMILTKQYSAINLLPDILGSRNYTVIFGSSFPHDHDYTEVCRNINRIKVCMETGRTVVLLNLRDLYESLYDALNQHYVTLAGQRYVDLGLGGHRVKCRVAKKFKLVVIEEKEIVYEDYPIPLINRLEKHVFEMSSILTEDEKAIVSRLKSWIESCCKVDFLYSLKRDFSEQNTFLGSNHDSCASALLSSDDRSFERAKEILLQTATLDGVCRLLRSESREEADRLLDVYMNHQIHDSLLLFLQEELKQEKISVNEIVSFSQVLNEKDRQELQRILNLPSKNLLLLTLQQFQTEQQFSDRIDEFLECVYTHGRSFVLLIQCSQIHKNESLIACAKYAISNKIEKYKQERGLFDGSLSICFLLTLERRVATSYKSLSYVNFYSGNCSTIYVDQLKPNVKAIASVSKLWDLTVREIFLNDSDRLNEEVDLVDVRQLIRQCIPIAMAKLQNRFENLRSTRIQLMLSLCFQNPAANSFFDILLKKIHLLLEDRERKMPARDEWIIDLACSARSLQEGGTFTNVLWLRLKNIAAIAIAKIVSASDADNNLSLLNKAIQDSPKIAELWFKIFAHNHFWDMQWTSMTMNEESTFLVDGIIGFSCCFPFSRLVYDMLMKEWLLLKEANVQDQRKIFLKKMESFQISWILDTAEEIGLGAIECFTHDLVRLMYKPRSSLQNHRKEYDVVQNYILNLFQSQKNNQQLLSNALLEIFVMLMDNKKSLRVFAEVLEILPDILSEWQQHLANVDLDAFSLHQKTFEAIVVQLYNTAVVSFDSVGECTEWMSSVRKATFLPEKLISSTNKVIQNKWYHLLFVYMFLEELLPVSDHDSDKINRYLNFLSGHVRQLWSQAVTVDDLSDLSLLKCVVKILKICTEEIQLRLLCDWGEVGCIMCENNMLQEPVKLSCCQSYLCQKCATKEKTLNCPYCESTITHAEALQSQKLTDQQKEEFDSFNFACTSFFLEYLSTFCFPTIQDHLQNANADPPGEEIFLALEELVVNDNRTKVISPVLAEMDLDPTARSYILQLLLRCDETMVEEQLENHFNKMEQVLTDRTALMMIYIKCKQDLIQQSCFASNSSSQLEPSLTFAYTKMVEAVSSARDAATFSQLDHLRVCAKLQYVAKVVVSHIIQITDRSTSDAQLHEIKTIGSSICRNCATPEFLIFRQFIVKCLCRRYGTDALNIMLENDLFRRLVPENLLPQAGQEKDSYFQADKLSLTGEKYCETKTLLLDIAQESDDERVLQQILVGGHLSPDYVIQTLLAASVWVAYDRENPARLRTFKTIRSNIRPDFRSSVFESIAQGLFEELKCTRVNGATQYALMELLQHFAVLIASHRDRLLQPFMQMAQNPNLMLQMFLPTMPGVDYDAVRGAMRHKKAHLCPNGHPYYIGECGRPMQVAKCPACGADVGGQGHRLLGGNRAGEITEQSQAGYKIRKNPSSVPERKLSRLSVCATRICLHLAMLLGSRCGDVVARMVQRGRGQEVDFIFEEILFDLREISKLIGCSVDDAYMLMHLVFNGMRTTQNPNRQNFGWNNMNEREVWESEFQQCFLAPVFSNTTNLINQALITMLNAGKLTERPLERLVYELKKDEALPDGIVPWNHPNLWKYMLHVDINHLRQTLEGIAATSECEGAALKLIINNENLEIIRHLLAVITVQSAFIKRYGQKIDQVDAENTTIQDFLEKENFIYDAEIETYMQVWNKIKTLVVDRHNISLSYLDEDMTHDSPISMCLPSRRGRGLCAFLLADYLMEKQNELLLSCRELVEPKPSLKTIDVEYLEISDLIYINPVEDLMPIVLENSQYETTVTDNGLKHNISYNLALLQKKVLRKFIFGKSIINKETLPLMKYPQDTGLANDIQAIDSRGNQLPLPLKTSQEIDDAIENSITPKLCEVVRTMNIVIRFIAKDTNIDQDQRIFEFAEQELLLPPEETEMIHRSALISHCLGLYERLSWHRSKRLIENGQNPFENVKNAEDITNLLLVEKVKRALMKITPNISRLQLELNSILMFGPSMDNPEWSLVKDVLLPYLELKDEDADHSWCEQIPDEVLFKHAVNVFNLSMNYAT